MSARIKITLKGLVQGVGFRPFVYNLAKQLELSGSVCNTGWGVVAEFQGPHAILEQLPDKLRFLAPAAAEIIEFHTEVIPLLANETDFIITQNIKDDGDTIIPYDQAICDQCLQEFYDPAHRHYMNFFISCTACGPRYSIIRSLPYDRERTSMDAFPMCPVCRQEYNSPSDRRFHAQATTCPACGPRYFIYSCREDKEIPLKNDAAVLNFASQAVNKGQVIALQGIGGFHLLCDPENRDVVAKLRDGKRRDRKPLAIIAKTWDSLAPLCCLTVSDKEWFSSRQNPILLLPLQETTFEHINDGLGTLGVMRPYTAALDYLLKTSSKQFLIATSGNISGYPMATSFAEAQNQLPGIADYIVHHNRDIVCRCDDAVAFCTDTIVVTRSGRGFAPLALLHRETSRSPLLAMGAEQKITVSTFKNNKITTSEYLGDLDTFENRNNYDAAVDRFLKLQHCIPAGIIRDLHPDYYSSRAAEALAAKYTIPVTAVQHHEAHIASVMLEHDLTESIGFAFDGTGYGRDGSIWGGEGFIAARQQQMDRFFHLSPFPLVGGAKAIEEPVRLLYYFLRRVSPSYCERLFNGDNRLEAIYRSAGAANYPLTSSIGRLFDIAAVLLGCGSRNDYDAMLPMHLESLANPLELTAYPLTLNDGSPLTFSPEELIALLAADAERSIPPDIIAARFQNTLAWVVTKAASIAHARTGIRTVTLSGGVFQNRLLLTKTKMLLTAANFQVFHNNRVPINDSGISIGQIASALYFPSATHD